MPDASPASIAPITKTSSIFLLPTIKKFDVIIVSGFSPEILCTCDWPTFSLRSRVKLHAVSQIFGGPRSCLWQALPRRLLPPHPDASDRASGTCSRNTPAETRHTLVTAQLARPLCATIKTQLANKGATTVLVTFGLATSNTYPDALKTALRMDCLCFIGLLVCASIVNQSGVTETCRTFVKGAAGSTTGYISNNENI